VTSDVPLYQRDPEAWQAHLAEGNRTQPRKRVGADVLFRDEAERVLLVDPRYKPDWDLPGGMATEELGIEFAGGRVLVIDWVAPHGPWDDSLMFVFDGGVLTRDDLAKITLRDDELSQYRLCAPPEASRLLRPYVSRRVEAARAALREGRTYYLHDGRPS
jgi:8-oxo-dGTP diphosphatase